MAEQPEAPAAPILHPVIIARQPLAIAAAPPFGSDAFGPFEARHIINTRHDDDDNLVNRYAALCFVTKRVLEDGAPVGYLYREEPDNGDDSGWRFTANDESDDYINDSANVALVSLGAVLRVDDRFIRLLDSPAGSAYAFDHNTQQFMAVDE